MRLTPFGSLVFYRLGAMSTSAISDITGKEQSYHVDQQDKAWCPVAQGQEVLKIVVFFREARRDECQAGSSILEEGHV